MSVVSHASRESNSELTDRSDRPPPKHFSNECFDVRKLPVLCEVRQAALGRDDIVYDVLGFLLYVRV